MSGQDEISCRFAIAVMMKVKPFSKHVAKTLGWTHKLLRQIAKIVPEDM